MRDWEIDLEDISRRESALTTILMQMDVPAKVHDTSSIRNLKWISRNLAANNKNHPLFETAIGLTVWLLKYQR